MFGISTANIRVKPTIYLLSILTVYAIFASVIQPAYSATPLTAVEFASGLSSPVFVTAAPGDTSRLFVVEQGGRVRIVQDTLLTKPFLNISSIITSGGERGLLGLAFHPDYSGNGYFYVNYTNLSGNTVIARYKVSANPDTARTDSAQILLTITQPFSNHNAGWLGFSPNDGYLYIPMGDGGSAGDPGNRAQNNAERLGKVLRIDIDTGAGYKIPPDNPYKDSAGYVPEMWAKGLRNPWRCSFDRQTGDFYIGDVGQGLWEEVDFQPASSAGKENYGWRLKEGDHCYNPSVNCDPGGLTDPIHEYPHNPEISITGGYVYRGNAIPDLRGAYFFGDYGSGKIWSFKYDGVDTTEFRERTAEFNSSSVSLSSFGEDAQGELYFADLGTGRIYKIVPLPCSAIPGDANASNDLTLGDIIATVNYNFDKPGYPPCASDSGICWLSDLLCRGNWNGDGVVSLADVFYAVNMFFDQPGGPWDPVPNGVCCLPVP